MNDLLANPAFDTALIALVGALAGYIQVRTQQAKQGAHIVDLQRQAGSGAPTAPTTVVAMPSSGGSGTSVPVVSAPVYNQLNDPLPDASQDPYATTDCGEESVSMVVAACGGPVLPAGQFRMLLGGTGRRGSSTAADLVYLLKLFNIQAHSRQCDAGTAWVEWGHSQHARYLVIALGYWVTVGYLHWVVITGCDDSGVTFNDPWGGVARHLSTDEAQKLYMGVYVHVDQPVSAPAPAPPGD